MKYALRGLGLVVALHCSCLFASESSWHPSHGPLETRWAKEVSPANAHPEYPRPQLVRREWRNLDGLWDFTITAKDSTQPDRFGDQILVPFPVESALSGVMRSVTEKDRLWYRRAFTVPRRWAGQRVLLHFGAVDFQTTVFVNGTQVTAHRGGYDPFTVDITDALNARGANELVVSVWDPTDGGKQPRGKQVRRPDQGIFYTGTSGIWQTVWLEPVPAAHIESVRTTPDIDGEAVTVFPTVTGGNSAQTVTVTVLDGRKRVYTASGNAGMRFILPVQHARLWSPQHPFLYGLEVTLNEGGKRVDAVTSYFGMRKVALGKDSRGVTKIFLNNEPYFMLGPLDQGFWPDGIYTAPTDAALRYDIEMTKQMGFNMCRKHVKVEPERWYYWCDKLGLLVWQDMPSGDRFIGGNDPDLERTPESAREFETELKALIETHDNHPCIVMWVVFNEGWGQYDTPRLTRWVKELDPTRLVDDASGWADRGVGDVHDMHRYPGPGSPKPEADRAAVLGEFGGLGFKVDGHTWAGRTWGYRGMASVEVLHRQYTKLLRGVYALREDSGLSAAVYTQTTDVEYEGNGLMTYDRALVKMGVEAIAAANRGEFAPEPKVIEVVPTSQREGIRWWYTTDRPAGDWFKPEFEAAGWSEGPGGFGTRGTPGAVVRTEWRTADIWLRRQFTLPEGGVRDPQLLMHHDEDAEVYLNGVLAAKVPGFITDYEQFEISPTARSALKPGRNVMAVHCHQTTGGQYIDVGIVTLEGR